jgi:hypothetical protein
LVLKSSIEMLEVLELLHKSDSGICYKIHPINGPKKHLIDIALENCDAQGVVDHWKIMEMKRGDVMDFLLSEEDWVMKRFDCSFAGPVPDWLDDIEEKDIHMVETTRFLFMTTYKIFMDTTDMTSGDF